MMQGHRGDRKRWKCMGLLLLTGLTTLTIVFTQGIGLFSGRAIASSKLGGVVVPTVSRDNLPPVRPPKTTTPPPPKNTPTAKPAKTNTAQPPTPSPQPPTSNPQSVEPPIVPPLSAEDRKRNQQFIQADQLYLGGQFAQAEKIYRALKPPFATDSEPQPQPEPISDPEQLSPAGRVYWREAATGTELKLETRILIPLKLLSEQVPQFIPGQIRYAQALKDYSNPKEALAVLERATTRYPNNPDLLRARIAAMADAEQWMDASILARRFALLNPNHPASPEFSKLADTQLQAFQNHLREKLTGNAIANLFTGAIGLALGSVYSPISAISTTTMLLEGESRLGERVASYAKRQLKLIDDPEVTDYVKEVGQRLATVAGRQDFQYEFYVVNDEDLNAFALPGGKVFVNAGAIAKTNSEAELAGLLGHELSHAVLSHAFQVMTDGNLLSNFTQWLPLGGTLGNLVLLSYSRDMERQADFLGTRILASTGYAADGVRNLMVNLQNDKKDKNPDPIPWLSTHPMTEERVHYLEAFIQEGGYNRYAFEGVARHEQIKAKVVKILEAERQKEKDRKAERS